MEYNITFQDNILAQDFNNTARGITNWIRENRIKHEWAKDPNAYEMANVFLFGAKYASQGQQIDIDTLDEMWEMRSKDFENCNVSRNHFVYRICEDAHTSVQNGKALVNDENSHHALRKMAGIGLYLKQQQRDGQKPQYNNLQELQNLIEVSRTLKGVHPDLFDKYKFSENINVLCSLIERNLDEQTKEQLFMSRDELLQGPKKLEKSKTQETTPDAR